MENTIESIAFRRLARSNCYRYGCLYVHTDKDITFDKHNFPNYSASDNGSGMEEFLALMNNLGNVAGGNDPTEKLAKTLPIVKWSGDQLSMTINLDGTMYFLDNADYQKTKRSLKSMLVSQGWQLNEKGSVTSYTPAMNGANAMFVDDPMDAAGRAMMFNSMQTASAQLQVYEGLVTQNVAQYAEGKSRLQGKDYAESKGLGGRGILGNLKVAQEAYAANTAQGIMVKWATAGHAIELLVDGQQIRKSIPGILSDASFTESAYVVDKSGNMYPTQMDVSIQVTNMYGSLFNTMKVSR